jgi:Helix-turn-helix domain
MPPLVLADYMTRAQLALELGIHERTLIRWSAYGDGPPVTKLGNRVLYRRTSFAAWLAKREGVRPS